MEEKITKEEFREFCDEGLQLADEAKEFHERTKERHLLLKEHDEKLAEMMVSLVGDIAIRMEEIAKHISTRRETGQ